MCLQITKHAKLQKKQVDDVLGGDEAWKNVQKTDGKSFRRLRGSCCSNALPLQPEMHQAAVPAVLVDTRQQAVAAAASTRKAQVA